MAKDEIVRVEDIEDNVINKIIDGFTGVITSEKADYAISANRVLKSIISRDFLQQLSLEWDNYAQKGKVKLNYKNSKTYMNNLCELLDYLDNDLNNDEVAETLKKLFFIPAFETNDDEDNILVTEYIKTVKKLNSGDLIALFTAYKMIGERDFQKIGNSVDMWLKAIATNCSLKYISLVEVCEENLITYKLINPRTLSDKSGTTIKPYFRLTDYGYNLCRYIELYDSNIRE